MQSEQIRHRLTSLTPANQTNDVMRDVTCDSKRASVDVTDQTSIQLAIEVCKRSHTLAS